MRYNILLSLFLIGCAISVSAQVKYDFPQFGHETIDFFKQPGTWQSSDYIKLGVLTATSFLLMETADSSIRRIVLGTKRSYFTSIPIEWGRMWGELYMPCIVFSAYAAHSLIFNDIGTRKIAYEVGQASLYAGAITFVMKVAFSRARPLADEGPTSFHLLRVFEGDYHSFPSGHSAAAMVLSTVLARNTTSTWLKILAYTPPLFTIVSRIYQDKHWLSDAVFGGVMGYFVAKWVVDMHEEKEAAATVPAASMPIYPINISIVLN